MVGEEVGIDIPDPKKSLTKLPADGIKGEIVSAIN